MKPFAKAVAPAFLTLVGTAGYSLAAGHFDKTSTVIAVVGLISSAVTYFVPNAQPVEVPQIGTLLAPVIPLPAPVAPAPAPVAPPQPPVPPTGSAA